MGNIVNNYGHTALHCAVIVNNIEGLKLLHSHPSLTALTLNQKDKNFGATPVMWAVRSGELEQLALLAADPRVDLDTIVVDDDSWSMLHWAVRNDTIEAVKLLLNISRLDVNIVNNIGETALHWAVKFSKKIETLKLLLNVSNIDVNIVNNYGQTAWHRALIDNNIEAFKLLLNVSNIDVNVVDSRGQTALHWAVTRSIEALKLLLSHPSLTALTLNQKDKSDGATPVMLALKYYECGRTRLEHLAVLVADPRVDLDTTDKDGRSLEKNIRYLEAWKMVEEAKKRREERRQENINIVFLSITSLKHHRFSVSLRLVRYQQRQVSKVLLDGLYDPDSPISKLLGVRTEIVGEIIWK